MNYSVEFVTILLSFFAHFKCSQVLSESILVPVKFFFAHLDRRHAERHHVIHLLEKKKKENDLILVAVFNCEVSLLIIMTYFWAIQRERTPIFLWSFLYISISIYLCCCWCHLEKMYTVTFLFSNENMVVSNIRERNVTVNILHCI